MRIRRLGWAGVEIRAGGSTAVIDLLEDVGPMKRFIGEAHGPLPGPAEPGTVSLALVTHMHADHADPHALARALRSDGVVLRPAPADDELMPSVAETFAELGLNTHVVEPWDTVRVGPFAATAIPAVDGFGDPQISWALAADGRRVLHCGDTLFHGWWWLARQRYGPFDAIFLPVNGPVVSLPGRQPHSSLPAAMDPRQAAEAAALLHATIAIPIHYDTLENPPRYTQVDRPAETFVAAAEARGVRAHALAAGEELELADPAAAGAGL
jgi:L-ascorbate metabolism protein UlaG (beta-lactamase superfamily)